MRSLKSKPILEETGIGTSGPCIFNNEQDYTRNTGQILNDGRQTARRSVDQWSKLYTTAAAIITQSIIVLWKSSTVPARIQFLLWTFKIYWDFDFISILFYPQLSKCCRKCNSLCGISARETRSALIGSLSLDISAIHNQLLDHLFKCIETQTIKLIRIRKEKQRERDEISIVIPKNAFYFKGTSQNEHTVLDGACSEVSSWNQSISFNDEWMNFWYFFLINRKIIYVRHHDLSFFIWWQVWNFYQSIAIALTLSNAVCCTPTTNNSISTQPYLIQSFVIQMKIL